MSTYEQFTGIAEASGGSDAVESPAHYSWLGQSLAALYLLRQGRKGGEEKRLEDLRKARQYLDRRIAQLTESEVSD